MPRSSAQGTVRDEHWNVLIVDDEPITAAAHADFAERISGFRALARVGTGQEALRYLERCHAAGTTVDLVLLDMNLPDLHGLDVARRMRGRGYTMDIIAITAVRDLALVRAAVSAGITQYLIKPFTFAAFRTKLESFREFQSTLGEGTAANQDSIDDAFAALRPATSAPLPKGLIPETLRHVSAHLENSVRAQSATEVAAALSMSRVTARRYLEHLAVADRAARQPRHGSRGRPEYEYRWLE
nr:response regulator [Zhihengliuella flava]